MPKSVKFADADFGFKTVTTQKNTNTTFKNIDNTPKSEIAIQNVDREAYMQNIKARNQEQSSQNPVQISQKPLQTQNSTVKVTQKTVNQKPTPVAKNTSTQPKVVKQAPVPQKSTIVEKKQEPQKVVEQNKKITQTPKLVTESETIAWNKWRADLANEITKKAYSYQTSGAQKGTIYKYTFDVDKNRVITNINVKIYSGPSGTAEQELLNAIKKAISATNGSSILTFPNGTNRTKTSVTGGIQVADTTQYTDSSKFADYEVVKKQYYK